MFFLFIQILVVMLVVVGAQETATRSSHLENSRFLSSNGNNRRPINNEDDTSDHNTAIIPTLLQGKLDDGVEEGRDNLFLRAALCNSFRQSFTDSTCICQRPSFLRNRGFTVECETAVPRCILLSLFCFTLRYSGEFFLLRSNRVSRSELCLSEANNKLDVLCIRGEHCGNDLGCYETCTAEVGQIPCNSCNICPGGSGFIVDCKNVNMLLAYSDCPGANTTVTNRSGGLQTVTADTAFAPHP